MNCITNHFIFFAKIFRESILSIKVDFDCPISLEPFDDPVITPCGHTFNSPHITRNLEFYSNCPLDRKALTLEQLRPNKIVINLMKMISLINESS